MISTKSIFRSLVVASSVLGFLIISSCSDSSRIVGIVLDNFANPIEGATVSIESSAFESKTNSEGKFSLEYVPGTFSVQIKAAGYTDRTVQLEINKASEYPLDTTILYKIPPSGGVFLAGKHEYLPLAKSKIESSSQSAGLMSSKATYVIPDSGQSLEIDDQLVAEISKIHSDAGSETITIIDSVPYEIQPFELYGDQIGTAVAGTNSDSGLKGIEEVTTRYPNFLVRKFDYPASKLLEGNVICYASIAKNITGGKFVDSNQPAHCLSGITKPFAPPPFDEAIAKATLQRYLKDNYSLVVVLEIPEGWLNSWKRDIEILKSDGLINLNLIKGEGASGQYEIELTDKGKSETHFIFDGGKLGTYVFFKAGERRVDRITDIDFGSPITVSFDFTTIYSDARKAIDEASREDRAWKGKAILAHDIFRKSWSLKEVKYYDPKKEEWVFLYGWVTDENRLFDSKQPGPELANPQSTTQ